VGNAHGVEHASAGRGRRDEVGVPVQVQQPGCRIVALRAGDGADADRAVVTRATGCAPSASAPVTASATVRATPTTAARLRALDGISSATKTF
jgi:hypothetical protein